MSVQSHSWAACRSGCASTVGVSLSWVPHRARYRLPVEVSMKSWQAVGLPSWASQVGFAKGAAWLRAILSERT